jgi:diguanylate cyclase (GGDEF)-like protein
VFVEASNITEINQKFDRIEGDRALSAIAIASQKCLRDTDYLGRWDGLVFCALLPETSESEACVVTDRMKKTLCEIERSHFKGVVRVNFRLVAATWQYDESVQELISRAQALLINEKVIESKG